MFVAETDELFITSNQFTNSSGVSRVRISQCLLDKVTGDVKHKEIANDGIHMSNGSFSFQDVILFCAQGSMRELGGLCKVESQPPYQVTRAIFTLDRPFNSVNHVVLRSDGDDEN